MMDFILTTGSIMLVVVIILKWPHLKSIKVSPTGISADFYPIIAEKLNTSIQEVRYKVIPILGKGNIIIGNASIDGQIIVTLGFDLKYPLETTVTIGILKNNKKGNGVISITGQGTGEFEDFSGVDTFIENDTFSVYLSELGKEKIIFGPIKAKELLHYK